MCQDPKAEVMIFSIERQKGTITCVTPERVSCIDFFFPYCTLRRRALLRTL